MSKTWDNMTPEERDAWIAQHFMGLQVEYWTEETYKDHDPEFCYVTGYVEIHPPEAFLAWSYVLKYTRDWNAAWSVYQRMVEQHCVNYPDYDEVWTRFCDATNWIQDRSGNVYRWIATWTPESICKSVWEAIHETISEEQE